MPCPSIGPKLFWTIQIVLVRLKLSRLGCDYFDLAKIRLLWANLYNLVLFWVYQILKTMVYKKVYEI